MTSLLVVLRSSQRATRLDGRTAATGASAACEAAVLLNRVSGQSAENCSCVIRDASKPRTQSRYGEVNKRAHLRNRHAAGRGKQMYRKRRMFGIRQDDS